MELGSNKYDQGLTGSVLAEDVFAKDDLPPFRASVMDGYAVSSKNSSGVYDIVEQKSFAGTASQHLEKVDFEPGHTLYVTTGAPVPEYFDCVIPIE